MDSPARNNRLQRRLGVSFQFLSDPDLVLIDRLGIRYKRRSNPNESLALPTQYLVDSKRVIQWVYVTDTWRKRLPPKKVLEAVAPYSLT